MMRNSRPEGQNIIKDIRNLFRLKKETKAIQDRILRDIKNLFEPKEEENESLSVEEYLDKICPYLNNIINNLKKSDTWKIHLTFKNVFYTLQDPLRITKIKPLINKYNCKGLNLPSEKDNWKKNEKNNGAIVLYAKKKNIFCLYFKT